MKVEMKSIDSIVPYISNPRKNEKAVPKVKSSLKEFGFRQPIVVDEENVIIVGHTRYLAAKELGMTEVPIHVATGLTKSQIKAYRIADNKTATFAEWDDELLKLEFNDLKLMDFDLSLTGFEPKEIQVATMDKPEAKESSIDVKEEELQRLIEKYDVQLGQIWQMGSHKLAVGDCTDEGLVNRLLGATFPQVLFTSPPYWIGLEYEQESSWNEVLGLIDRFTALYAQKIHSSGRVIINTGMCPGKKLTSGDAHTKLLIDEWQKAFELKGWLLRYVRFWCKTGGIYHTNPDFDCIDNHSEFIGYFYNPKAKFRGVERLDQPWCGLGYWDDIPGASKGSGHIASFPVELVSRNIQLFTRHGEVVLDTFNGAGTTIFTCEQLGRIGYGIELNPGYVALTLERMKTEYPDLVVEQCDE
jgi:site-specific DNA-methyltransferase (adenine-specific)